MLTGDRFDSQGKAGDFFLKTHTTSANIIQFWSQKAGKRSNMVSIDLIETYNNEMC